MSAKSGLLLSRLRPSTRVVVVSVPVNSTKPSPETSARVEAAPAFQPLAPVFTSEAPVAPVPTRLVHTTGRANRPLSTTSVNVPAVV